MNEKTILRQKYKYLRDQLSLRDVMDRSHNICHQVVLSPEFMEAKQVFAYMALKNEVNLRGVLEATLEAGKSLAIPKVMDGQMHFFAITSLDQVAMGYYHILEPTTKDLLVPQPGDLMLVPGIAFDGLGYRIGYGGGFYDKYLARYQGVDFKTIGVCYGIQRLDALKADRYDLPVGRVVSEVLMRGEN